MRNLPFQLTDKLFVLGQDIFLTYLVKGNPCTLLDLGSSGSALMIEQQLKKLGVKPDDIGHLVVLHAHWDHVCGLPYMLKMFPNATVWGSSKARDVLSKQKIVDQFRQHDEKYCTRLMEMNEFEQLPEFLYYDTMTVDKVIEDGETITFGGTDVRFFKTPGHSPCTISAYIPSEKTIIISDAIGSYDPMTDEYIALFYQGLEMTLASAAMLEKHDADIVAFCHDSKMIFVGQKDIAHMYKRIKEELLALRSETEKMEKAGDPEEEMVDKLFQANYRGFMTRLYPPDYIRNVAPLLLKAVYK